MRWTILLAIVIGVALSPISKVPAILYDLTFPVVVMHSKLVSRDGEYVTIHMWGEKRRGCKFLGVRGYSLSKGGELRDASIVRVDMPETGNTRPTGLFDIGHWRVWPVSGSVAMSVYSQHDCDGRILNTMIAEVAL